jgi:hypothetical protein
MSATICDERARSPTNPLRFCSFLLQISAVRSCRRWRRDQCPQRARDESACARVAKTVDARCKWLIEAPNVPARPVYSLATKQAAFTPRHRGEPRAQRRPKGPRDRVVRERGANVAGARLGRVRSRSPKLARPSFIKENPRAHEYEGGGERYRHRCGEHEHQMGEGCVSHLVFGSMLPSDSHHGTFKATRAATTPVEIKTAVPKMAPNSGASVMASR